MQLKTLTNDYALKGRVDKDAFSDAFKAKGIESSADVQTFMANMTGDKDGWVPSALLFLFLLLFTFFKIVIVHIVLVVLVTLAALVVPLVILVFLVFK